MKGKYMINETLKIIEETKNIYPIDANGDNRLTSQPIDVQFSERMGQLRDCVDLSKSSYANWGDLLRDFRKNGFIPCVNLNFTAISGMTQWNGESWLINVHLNNLLFTYGPKVFRSYVKDIYPTETTKKSA
jgi:hypothetical protein